MEYEELIKFLKSHLSITIDQNTEFGPQEEIKVSLWLEEVEISTSSCTLPNLFN